MKIGRFNALVNGLANHFRPTSPIVSSAVYRLSHDQWFDSKNKPVTHLPILDCLRATASTSTHWRHRNSLKSWYWIEELQSVVGVETTSPIKGATRSRLNQAIQECFKHSMDSHDATHDGLTGVLNSKAFEDQLSSCLTYTESSEMGGNEAIQPLSSMQSTALLSFDLDHFKQVNDSYGHDYGDIVLVAFSNRVQKTLIQLHRKHPALTLKLGRVGGEEFSIIVTGNINEDIVLQIAEQLKSAIADTPLPDESEWEGLPQESRNSTIAIPHISDRKVTASVGASSIVTPTAHSACRKLVEKLRHEADASLYRAKAGGRNVVRYFPSIRDKYGFVIEHHIDTGIVAIDIGKDVNVQLGHEFSVFHPDFTGEKPFTKSDGRSKKTLGTYPRISCGRLVVFDTQREVAFCFIEDKKCIEVFPAGSALQFIPAGSIKHLITGASGSIIDFSSRMTPAQEFQDSVHSVAEAGADFSVATLVLLNASVLEDSHGVSTINKSLADLFRLIDSALPMSAKISHISSFDISFCILGWTREDLSQVIESIISQAEERSMGLGSFGAGIYDSLDPQVSYLDKRNALDLSRFAASPLLLSPESKIAFFGPRTAEDLLHSQRVAMNQIDGQQDYARLVRLGVNAPYFHNQGALCYLEAGSQNLDEAYSAICKATETGPDRIFFANKGIIQFAQDDFSGAELSFCEAESEQDYVLDDGYKPSRALSAYHAYKAGKAVHTAQELIVLLEEARSVPLFQFLKITDADFELCISDLIEGVS